MLRALRLITSLILFAIPGMMLSGQPPSSAATPTTLNTEAAFFGGANGDAALPVNGNLLYLGQAIYGSTFAGGGTFGAVTDLGVVFQIPAVTGTDGHQRPTILHTFSGPDGSHPNGSLIADPQGNLYGTTSAGGPANLGTIFKLINPHSAGTAWSFTLLHAFAGPDGANPSAGLTRGPDGALYGTARNGGLIPCDAGGVGHPQGCGTVFQLTASGTFRVLHTFNGQPSTDGAGPASNLVLDPAGNILGTTGGQTFQSLFGSLYKITPSGTFTVVTSFVRYGPIVPVGNIVRDAAGNVYGMVGYSGAIPGSPPPVPPGPAIFKVTAITHRTALLAILPAKPTFGSQGSGVVRDGAGNLYATTSTGGSTGAGAVFALSPSGTLTTLASLGLANLAPVGGVILDPTGHLWGTSSAGGNPCETVSNVTPTGCGTVFSLSP